MKDVRGKTAFITGGAAGIGLALAKVFGRAGMKVVIADLRQDHLDEAMAELKNEKTAAHAIRLDVSDRKAFAAAADEAERVFGKVHVVCNNAGVNIIRPIDEATFRKTVGNFYAAPEVAKVLAQYPPAKFASAQDAAVHALDDAVVCDARRIARLQAGAGVAT